MNYWLFYIFHTRLSYEGEIHTSNIDVSIPNIKSALYVFTRNQYHWVSTKSFFFFVKFLSCIALKNTKFVIIVNWKKSMHLPLKCQQKLNLYNALGNCSWSAETYLVASVCCFTFALTSKSLSPNALTWYNTFNLWLRLWSEMIPNFPGSKVAWMFGYTSIV